MRKLLAGFLTGMIIVSCGFGFTNWQFWLLIIYIPIYSEVIREWVHGERKN